MPDFAATVDAWAQKSQKRMEAVFRQSTQKTVSIAQSRIQVDTGYARASVRASTSSMPPIESGSRGRHGQTYSYDGGEIAAVIASAQLGGKIYVGWTANYVGHLNSGTSKMPGSHFVDTAVQQWQQTVNEVVAEAKSRVG